MRLTHALMACDLNPAYLEFWPHVSRAWREIVHVDPVLVLLAREEEIPTSLRDDPAVIPFEPLDGVHTIQQAQCIRLLYPALLEADGAVVISDIDLFPLDPGYFHRPLKRLDERFFVSYRDTRLDRFEVPIAYNAARPGTWAEIFSVSSVEDVRGALARWAARGPYDGRPAWEGWYRDQQVLFEALTSWTAASERVWTLDDEYTGFRRLDRLELVGEDGLEEHRRADILAGRYSDYTCLVPYRDHREVNDLVLELALHAAGTGGGTTPPRLSVA